MSTEARQVPARKWAAFNTTGSGGDGGKLLLLGWAPVHFCQAEMGPDFLTFQERMEIWIFK